MASANIVINCHARSIQIPLCYRVSLIFIFGGYQADTHFGRVMFRDSGLGVAAWRVPDLENLASISVKQQPTTP